MKLPVIILYILSPLLAFSQESITINYKIFDTKNQKVVSVDDIITHMDKADVLFFGEDHNDSTCHVLEFELVSKLSKKYPGKVGLSMEMFEKDCQNVLNEYLKGLIREKNFINEARAWHNYKDYRPMIELAKAENIPMIAANAPARYVNMVNRMGLNSLQNLDAIGRAWLPPLPIDTATGAYYDKFLQIMGGHDAMGGMQMYQAQNVWDATMAWSISGFLKLHTNYKLLQINGSFHSEDKLGVAAQLKRYLLNTRIVNIACISDGNYDNPDWSKYNKANDYILLTDPKLPRTF